MLIIAAIYLTPGLIFETYCLLCEDHSDCSYLDMIGLALVIIFLWPLAFLPRYRILR